MPGQIPLFAVFLYLAVVIAVQTVIDTYFSRPIMPGNTKRRATMHAVANGVALGGTILLMRLVMPLNHALLLSARERGSMAVAVLGVILEYFPWALPFIGLRGLIIQEWGMSDEIREKRQAWWSLALVGTIATLLLMGPLYIAYNVVHPLMIGVDEVLGE